MFWRNDNRFSHTLAFRLMVGYAAIAFLFALIAFTVFYVKLATVTMEAVDEEMSEEIDEMVEVWEVDGLDGLKVQLEEENLEEESEEFFLSVFNTKGALLAAMELPPWGPRQLSAQFVEDLLENSEGRDVNTVPIDDDDGRGRLLTVRIAPNLILQHGQSIESAREYLEIFQQLFWVVVSFSLILAGASGWFMANRALKGVAQVTRTASLISQGRFQERVPMSNPYLEINQLARAFNVMVDRVQDLIQRMREITDNIAHDLRSPLTRIRGIAEMSLINKSGELTPSLAAENTIEECDNLIEMIDTMLDLTEIEAGIQQLELEDIPIAPLLAEACDLFRPLADGSGVALHLKADDDIHIRTDRSSLQRIVCNLIENAVKYTPRGGSVFIGAKIQAPGVMVTVQDTGIGISANDLPNIFDRFYRTDQSRTKPGNGLGLSLVKALTTLLGGTIDVNSRPNRGSAFLVHLPHTR